MTEDTKVHALLDELAEEWGQPADAIRAYLDIQGQEPEDAEQDQFENAYQGTYESPKAYAEELLYEAYSEVLEAKVLWGVGIGSYVDFESIARDLDYNGMHFEQDPESYEFHVFDF